MYKTYNINTNDILDSKFKTLIFITVFEMGFQSSFIRILYLCSPSFKYLSCVHLQTNTHSHTHTIFNSFSFTQYMCSHLTLEIQISLCCFLPNTYYTDYYNDDTLTYNKVLSKILSKSIKTNPNNRKTNANLKKRSR